MNSLLLILMALLILLAAVQIVLLLRKPTNNLESLQADLKSLGQASERIERSVRDEIAKNREESSQSARQVREEMAARLKEFNDSVIKNIGEMSQMHKTHLDGFTGRIDKLVVSNEQRLAEMRTTIESKLTAVQNESTAKLDKMRQEASESAKASREEIARSLKTFGETLTMTLSDMGGTQRAQLSAVVEKLEQLTDNTGKKLDTQKTAVDERLKQIQADSALQGKQLREEVNATLKGVNDSLLKGLTAMSGEQQKQMEIFSVQLNKLTESNEQKLELLKTTVEQKLAAIQSDNSTQLEKMRLTVDEKLQSTLEKRLGESFRQVGERLEQVHKGLGEMQSLATGVGDLKKVLTNVKARGTWGEVQLGTLLEQVLAPDQYAMNVATRDGGERVEFAVKLPGRSADKDEVVWLPIDAKYPMEDYQRLIDAQDKGDVALADAAMKQLESRIKLDATSIRNKYLNPPKTTDFAILFLPTEGLFAEVLRRPGLSDLLQREYRVMVAGPTTLWSLLNSLQMGFKTLAIEKRSSEVWNLLGAVKTEWSKYGDVLAKVQKKLHEATNTIDNAQQRSRAVGRKLKTVQELPVSESEAILMLESTDLSSEQDIDEG